MKSKTRGLARLSSDYLAASRADAGVCQLIANVTHMARLKTKDERDAF